MYLRLFNDICFSSPCGGLLLWRSPDGRALRASRTLRSRSACRHSVSLCLVSKGPQFRAATPKPVFKVKAVVSRQNAWCACFVLRRGDNALWRSNTIQLPPLHGHTLPLCRLSSLSSARCVYAWPYFKNIGAAGFAVYSGPSFKGTSGMFYWTRQRFRGRVGTDGGPIRCPDALQPRALKLQNKSWSSGVLLQTALLNCDLVWAMLWSGEEEDLCSGSELAGWTEAVAERRFLLCRLGLGPFCLQRESRTLYQRSQVFFRSKTLSYTLRCWSDSSSCTVCFPFKTVV